MLDGATVHLEYISKDVPSEEATVEVLTPESKNHYVIVRSEKAALVNRDCALQNWELPYCPGRG